MIVDDEIKALSTYDLECLRRDVFEEICFRAAKFWNPQMSDDEEHKGVLLFDTTEPHMHGYLIIGNTHYQIVGRRVSEIRANLHIRKTGETEPQEDLFDGRSSQAGDRKQTLA